MTPLHPKALIAISSKEPSRPPDHPFSRTWLSHSFHQVLALDPFRDNHIACSRNVQLHSDSVPPSVFGVTAVVGGPPPNGHFNCPRPPSPALDEPCQVNIEAFFGGMRGLSHPRSHTTSPSTIINKKSSRVPYPASLHTSARYPKVSKAEPCLKAETLAPDLIIIILARHVGIPRTGYLPPYTDQVIESMSLQTFYGLPRCPKSAASSPDHNPFRHATTSDISIHSWRQRRHSQTPSY